MNKTDIKLTVGAIVFSSIAKDFIGSINASAAEIRDYDLYNETLGFEDKFNELNNLLFTRFSKMGIVDDIQKEITEVYDKVYEFLNTK